MKAHTFRYFLVPYLLFLIASMLLVTTSQHGDMVLLMNSIHNKLLDVFFKWWTHLGDGIFFGCLALYLLIRKKRHGYIFLIIGAAQGLISLLMKQVIFKGTPRPRKYFEDQEILVFVEGVKVHDFNSFPSGHTITAFAIATFFAITVEKKEWSLLFLLSAILVGLSRIYLNQHFLVDVAVGSLIGVMVAFFGYKIFKNYLSTPTGAPSE